MIPDFDNRQMLPSGLHTCSPTEFLVRFCEKGDTRRAFYKACIDVFDFAQSKNAPHVIFGGSFVTGNESPRDLDAVIVFRRKEDIPARSERLLLQGSRLDIMFCSMDDSILVSAFVRLLSTGRFGEELGVVAVELQSDSGESWQIVQEPDDFTYEIIKRAYIRRELIDLNEPRGVLITVHGLLSQASWNMHVVPEASSQGWIVAPYFYGFQTPEILVHQGKRKKAVDDFRDWLFAIKREYSDYGRVNMSLLAHSFGTYLVGAYLAGFEEPPVKFNTVILTGSILSTDFDWDAQVGKVGRVRNEVAPNDQWVKWMPEKKWIGLDPLFGRAGVEGFSKDSSILDQARNIIFDHNNVIKRDVVYSQWLPYLNANKSSLEIESYKEILKVIEQRASSHGE